MERDIYHSAFDTPYQHPGNQSLSHHGIMGMKWGVWNAETAARYSGAGDAKRPGPNATAARRESVGKQRRAEVKRLKAGGQKVTNLEARLIDNAYRSKRAQERAFDKIVKKTAQGKDTSRLETKVSRKREHQKMHDEAVKKLMDMNISERRARSAADTIGLILGGPFGGAIGKAYGTMGLYPSLREQYTRIKNAQEKPTASKSHTAGTKSQRSSSDKPYFSWSASKRTAFDNKYDADRKRLATQYKQASTPAQKDAIRAKVNQLETNYLNVVERDW